MALEVASEIMALVRLACVGISLNQVVIVASSVVVLLLPCCLVTLSYVHIVASIVKIHSTQGRCKAFETCASHLTVVSMSYGMALFIYLQPCSRASTEQDKVVVLFYIVLNPLIYSLRNKDVKAAVRRVLMRSSESKC
ncbi:olfactory receptor-like protein OLF3 [Octodon degus]|uniref:Olfactory receptor-like protein OLF3 n=1 Tax=Octodon degus TaxID=10160 RepID=A0A6P3VAH1_OCTDE|nr:olfactory receptor-like protein OLF3 [Octodon degus]